MNENPIPKQSELQKYRNFSISKNEKEKVPDAVGDPVL